MVKLEDIPILQGSGPLRLEIQLKEKINKKIVDRTKMVYFTHESRLFSINTKKLVVYGEIEGSAYFDMRSYELDDIEKITPLYERR